jgi:hypothetical protein
MPRRKHEDHRVLGEDLGSMKSTCTSTMESCSHSVSPSEHLAHNLHNPPKHLTSQCKLQPIKHRVSSGPCLSVRYISHHIS